MKLTAWELFVVFVCIPMIVVLLIVKAFLPNPPGVEWNPVKEVTLSDGTRCTYLQEGVGLWAGEIVPGSYTCVSAIETKPSTSN